LANTFSRIQQDMILLPGMCSGVRYPFIWIWSLESYKPMIWVYVSFKAGPFHLMLEWVL